MGYRTIRTDENGNKTEEITCTLDEYKAECVKDLKEKAAEHILNDVPVHKQLNAIWDVVLAESDHHLFKKVGGHRDQIRRKEQQILEGSTYAEIENIVFTPEDSDFNTENVTPPVPVPVEVETPVDTEVDTETYRREQLALLKAQTTEAVMTGQINALIEFLGSSTTKPNLVQRLRQWLLGDLLAHPEFEKISAIRRKAADIEAQLLDADEETLHAITWEFK